jgi:hypothetical protein
LKKGEDVMLENGSIIKSSEVVGPRIKGRKIVVLGDTSHPYPIKQFGSNCDLLVHESTVEEGDDHAKDIGHSTPKMAGKFARAINASRLALTHFPRRLERWDQLQHHHHDPTTIVDWTLPVKNPPIFTCRDHKPSSYDESTNGMVSVAATHFGSNAVLGAKDFLTIPIPRGGFSRP